MSEPKLTERQREIQSSRTLTDFLDSVEANAGEAVKLRRYLVFLRFCQLLELLNVDV